MVSTVSPPMHAFSRQRAPPAEATLGEMPVIAISWRKETFPTAHPTSGMRTRTVTFAGGAFVTLHAICMDVASVAMSSAPMHVAFPSHTLGGAFPAPAVLTLMVTLTPA